MYVYCEKLILIADPARHEWWRALLGPREQPFSGGGRCERASDPEDAVAKALQAREEGFRAILVCPSEAARERVDALLRARRRPLVMLVRGYDDTAITALLRGPSREVLLALAGQRTLIEPANAYMDALRERLGGSPSTQEFLRRVEAVELRLQDFRLISEPGESTQPVREYGFEWRLDPTHHLAVALNPLQGEARLVYTVAGQARSGSVQVAAGEDWELDNAGARELTGRDLHWIAEAFDIDDDYLRRWDDMERGPLLPPESLSNVQAWLKDRLRWPADASRTVATGAELPMPLLNSSQWKAAFGALASAGPASEAGRASQEGGAASDAAMAAAAQLVSVPGPSVPLLLTVPGEPDLTLNVRWEPIHRRAALPHSAPDLAVNVDGKTVERARAEWQEGFRRVSVSGVSLPEHYRYGWEWDSTNSRLELRIETLPGCVREEDTSCKRALTPESPPSE